MERWQSSEAREEIHLFVAGTQVYVMGFNPRLINEEHVLKLLEREGFYLPLERIS